MKAWSEHDIPPLSGKIALVTGATGGLGLETVRALAAKGATVMLAGRNAAKGAEAVKRVVDSSPQADIRFLHLDMADLASIERASHDVAEMGPRLDILINNAGVSMPPKREVTRDGFELQFGTNHLGHVALTARLLPCLLRAPQSRVVNVSSVGHRVAPLDFENLQSERPYDAGIAYSRSKLAQLMFALSLHQLSEAKGWPLQSIPAHPGLARSNLLKAGPSLNHANGPGVTARAGQLFIDIFGQSTADGALSILYAATSPDARGGHHYGPSGWFEFRGPPGPAKIGPYARDLAAQERLWELSARLTGVGWP